MSESSWMSGQPFHAYLRALFESDLSPAAKVVGAVLADFANDDRVAWPSAATIGKRCHMSRQAVVRVLKQLQGAGWVTKEPLNGQMTARRALCHPEALRVPPDAPCVAPRSAARPPLKRNVSGGEALRVPTVLFNVLENDLMNCSPNGGARAFPTVEDVTENIGPTAETPEQEHARLAAEADVAFGGDGDIKPPEPPLLAAVRRYCGVMGITDGGKLYNIFEDCTAWSRPESYGGDAVDAALVWGTAEQKPWRGVASRIRNYSEKSGWVDGKAATPKRKPVSEIIAERNKK